MNVGKEGREFLNGHVAVYSLPFVYLLNNKITLLSLSLYFKDRCTLACANETIYVFPSSAPHALWYVCNQLRVCPSAPEFSYTKYIKM